MASPRLDGTNAPVAGTSATAETRPGPYSRIHYRLRVAWPLKFAGTVGFMAAFFWGYFTLLRHPLFPVTLMPVTALDRALPFQSWTVIFYASLWFYVAFAPALLVNRAEMREYCVKTALLAGAGLAIFLFWPTAIPKNEIDRAQYAGFGFLQSVDATGNACPSLHAAFAVYSAAWFARMLRQMGDRGVGQWLNLTWCAAIVYSTLATKQHVVIDVVAGVVLGTLAAGLPLRGSPRT